MRLCALSVDLDEIGHYHRIHGLSDPPAGRAHPVYDVALERCLALAAEHDLPLTLFVVARDLERAENAAGLARAVALGHEIGNHSWSHPYDLVRRARDEQRAEIADARELIAAKLGVAPLGFRAPGYTVTDALLRLVAESGHRYDSSVFPCPPYYAAKALAFGALALGGRRSAAILDTPRVLGAPVRPYRPGTPYFRPAPARAEGAAARDAEALVELPIQVTRGARLPYIGTALILAGSLGARGLTELVVGEPFVNLELHGIDVLGAEDGLDALFGYQPDARHAAAKKRRILDAQLRRLKRAGYRFVRLAEAADAVRAGEL